MCPLGRFDSSFFEFFVNGFGEFANTPWESVAEIDALFLFALAYPENPLITITYPFVHVAFFHSENA